MRERPRLPWFAVWVPATLLLYTLVNGAGHVRVAYYVLGVEPGREATWALRAAAPFCGLWFFLIVPVMAVFALVSWKTCPQWSGAVRWGAGMLGLFLGFLFLLTQVVLLCPAGWGKPLPTSTQFRVTAVQLWRPQLRRTALVDFNLWTWTTAEWRAQAPAFVALLEHPNSDVRTYAIIALWRMEAKEVTVPIAGLLKAPRPRVRAWAASVLGTLDAKAYIPQIAAALKDPDAEVRMAGAHVLGKLVGKQFSCNAGDVEMALAWWEAHKNDPEFAPKPEPRP